MTPPAPSEPAGRPPPAGSDGTTSREVTPSHATALLAALPSKHRMLVEAIAAGATIASAAGDAGLTREHASRLLGHDAAVKGAVAALSEELAEHAADRVRRLRSKALGVAERKLDADDTSVALAVIREVGLSLPGPQVVVVGGDGADDTASVGAMLAALPEPLRLLVCETFVEVDRAARGELSVDQALANIAQSVDLSSGVLNPPKKPPREPTPATVDPLEERPKLGKRKLS